MPGKVHFSIVRNGSPSGRQPCLSSVKEQDCHVLIWYIKVSQRFGWDQAKLKIPLWGDEDELSLFHSRGILNAYNRGKTKTQNYLETSEVGGGGGGETRSSRSFLTRELKVHLGYLTDTKLQKTTTTTKTNKQKQQQHTARKRRTAYFPVCLPSSNCARK